MWGDRLELIICFGRVTFSTAFRPKSFGKRLVSEQIYTKAINNSVILLINQMRKFSCFSIPIFWWFFNCKKRNTSKIQLKYHPKMRTEKDKFQSKGRNRALSEVHKIPKDLGISAQKQPKRFWVPDFPNSKTQPSDYHTNVVSNFLFFWVIRVYPRTKGFMVLPSFKNKIIKLTTSRMKC